MNTIGSLFSGIGGLELGLEWAGVGRTAWQVEQDEWCRRVLARHWPDANRSVIDVRLAGKETLPRVDVLCGGFPCQDISQAGKGAGLSGERSGLWREMLRVIRELGPRIVVLENVSAITIRGLDTVLGSLAEAGYDAEWSCLRALDVGAPHRRERWFCVAHPNGDGLAKQWWQRPERCDAVRCNGAREGFRDANAALGPTALEPRLGRDPYGLSARVDGYRWPAPRGMAQHAHEPPRVVEHYRGRRERLKALGNAVVPQCAYHIGLQIRAMGLL